MLLSDISIRNSASNALVNSAEDCIYFLLAILKSPLKKFNNSASTHREASQSEIFRKKIIQEIT